MVAHLLRLKLTLLRNGLRRSVWQTVALVVGALYGLGAISLAVIGLVFLGTAEPEDIRLVLVPAGAVLVLAWWIVPLVAFGVDATLDPARFVTFSIPRRDLLTGLALSGLVGLPGATTAVVVLATALTWRAYPVAVLASLLCAVLALATAIIGSRATTTALSSFVGRRRYREFLAVATIVPVFLLGPLVGGLTTGLSSGRDSLPAVARIIGWTPWGAPWAIPADVALRNWAGAGGKLAIVLATLVGLVVVWDRALTRALVAPASGGARRRSSERGLGAFGWLPATPTGAIAARCLTYWVRDPRYAAAVMVVPLFPVLVYFTAGGHVTGALLLTGPIAGFVLGWTISADIAYDSTAFWTHVAAPIDGRADRAGRVVAAVVVGVPAMLVLVGASVAVTGRVAALPGLVGVSTALLLTALGWASVVSARVVYQVPRPGENPFGAHQGTSMVAAVSQLIGWAVILGVSLPVIVLAAFAVTRGSVVLGLITLVLGIGQGLGALAIGIRSGGRRLDGHAPELLERMVSFG
ncbi:MAG: hypothetical protein ACOH2F_12380 [Cellulomonas sp.]